MDLGVTREEFFPLVDFPLNKKIIGVKKTEMGSKKRNQPFTRIISKCALRAFPLSAFLKIFFL